MARAFKRVKNTQLCISMFINEITHTHTHTCTIMYVCMYHMLDICTCLFHLHGPAWAFIARQCLVILVKYIKSRALWYLYPG